MARPTASSWMNLTCGDTVCAVDDPRHHGRIEAIANSATVKVRWNDNGFLSYLPLEDVRKVDDRLDRIGDLDVVTTQAHSRGDAHMLVELLRKRNINAVTLERNNKFRVILID